jgi:hypothetical protein
MDREAREFLKHGPSTLLKVVFEASDTMQKGDQVAFNFLSDLLLQPSVLDASIAFVNAQKCAKPS